MADPKNLERQYPKYVMEGSVLDEAKRMLEEIIPHIQSRFPFIAFDDISIPFQDSAGRYNVMGCYETKMLWVLPYDRFVAIGYGPSEYGSDIDHQAFRPAVRFDSGAAYEFASLKELDDLLERNVSAPKK